MKTKITMSNKSDWDASSSQSLASVRQRNLNVEASPSYGFEYNISSKPPVCGCASGGSFFDNLSQALNAQLLYTQVRLGNTMSNLCEFVH